MGWALLGAVLGLLAMGGWWLTWLAIGDDKEWTREAQAFGAALLSGFSTLCSVGTVLVVLR
jgi:hypothetical protein